jgi:hypothetical protein
LIENSSRFGEVPVTVAVQLGLLPVQEAKDEVDRASLGSNLDNSVQERRGRKRRSGSLTSMYYLFYCKFIGIVDIIMSSDTNNNNLL